MLSARTFLAVSNFVLERGPPLHLLARLTLLGMQCYVAGTPNIGARVTVHDSSGERVSQMGGSQPGEDFDQVTFLHSIATDSKGNLFAAEVSYTEIGQHGKPQRECMSLRMWKRAKN